MLHSRTLLLTHSMYNTLHLLILNSYSWVDIQTQLLFEGARAIMFAEALFTVVETWKQPVHQQMSG